MDIKADYAKESQKGEIMSQSLKDKVEGKLHQAKGAVKQKAGEVVGNPNLQDEGRAEKNAGKVQKKVGDIEKVFDK